MGIRRASSANLTGTKYSDASGGGTKIPDVPDTPDTGTPTLTYVTASVPFTPKTTGGTPTLYTATSTPGGITGTGTSSPIAVSLADGTAYTFKVTASNTTGSSPAPTTASSSVTTLTYPTTDTDNFNRTVSGGLGSTSGNTNTWANITGTFAADGSYATSADATAIAVTHTAPQTNITNLAVDTLSTGGVGLAWWVTDANNYYAATVYHSTSSTSTSTCNGSCAQGGGYCGNCCGGNYTYNQWCADSRCCDGRSSHYCANPGIENSYWQFYCQVSGRGACSFANQSYTTIYVCNAYTTTTTTYYKSNVRLIKNGSAVVDSQYDSNTSAYLAPGSIAISTAGGTISYTIYSGAGKTGTSYASSTYVEPSPVKTRFLGVYKGDGGTVQGSSVDNFSMTVS